MKTQLKLLTIFHLLSFICLSASAQGTAFTYQGRLNSGGSPASGLYDYRFKLYADPLGSSQVGSSYLTNAIPVTNGLFVTTIDFGAGIFTGSNYWLEVDVKTNLAGGYTVLSPLQGVTPTPYAIFATTASNVSGTVSAAQLSGAVANGNLPSSPIVSGTVTAGSFSGNGANVTSVNAAALNGLSAGNFWQLGGNNVAGGQFLGSTNNQPVEIWAGDARALRLEPDAGGHGAPNVIGGSPVNYVVGGVVGAVIGGGGATFYGGASYTNSVAADFGTVAGGQQNTIQAAAQNSAIGGGSGSTIQAGAYNSTIGGGQQNMIQINAYNSLIGGGANNTNQASYSAIDGGEQNTIQTNAYDSTIGGGWKNTIQTNAFYSMIGGGRQNTIQANSNDSMIGSGQQNTIQSSVIGALIAGGQANMISNNASGSVIGGGDVNVIQANAQDSTIGGGEQNTIQANSFDSLIAGGGYNTIQANVQNSTIGGGQQNTIQSNANDSMIGGGYQNQIQSYAYQSTIGGGFTNLIDADQSTIGGGANNLIQSGAWNSTIAGGWLNQIQVNAYDSTIGGGYQNQIQTSANQSTIGGGFQNLILNNAVDSVIGGGGQNQIHANFATIPGGNLNVASGVVSFAAGQQAQALHQGAFVWADSQNAPFASTANDQFLIRAQGGVGIGATNLAAGGALTIRSPMSAPPVAMNAADNALVLGSAGTSSYKWIQSYGAQLTLNPLGNSVGVNTTNPTHPFQVINAYCDGSSWVNVSDRNLKQDFAPVDAQAVLAKVAALPVQSWVYKAQPEQKHVGPVAQDFHAAFGLGQNDTSISTVDEGGVALAAIQGLNQKVEEKDVEIADLKSRLEKLEQLMQQNNRGAK